MIQGISHIVIYTMDMERSVRFYRDILGLSIDSETPYWTEVKIKNSQTYIGLHHTDMEVDKKGTTEVTFQVENITKAEEWLKSNSVKITRSKIEIAPGRWVVNFVDPDNNPLSIFSLK